MNILVTGAGGFIGTRLVAKLIEEKPEAKVFTCGLAAADFPHHIVCDLSHPEEVKALVQQTKPDKVFHLAGISRVVESLGMPEYFAQNFLTTVFLADEVIRAGKPARFLFTSSVHVYGNQAGVASEDTPVQPGSTYAFTKFLAEQALKARAKANPNFNLVIARLYSCFGPGQTEGFVTADFCRKITALPKDNSQPLKVGPLYPIRRFIDVRDVVKVLARLVDAKTPTNSEIFNIASPHELTIGDILNTLLRLSGKTPKVESSGPSDNRFTGLRLSVEKLTQTLPGLSFRPVEETLRDMLSEVRAAMLG